MSTSNIKKRATRTRLALGRVLRGGGIGAIIAAASVLGSAPARAGTPYSIDWKHTEHTAAGSCEGVHLGANDGSAFFSVNATPLPTYEVPGSYGGVYGGDQWITAKAQFDSTLLYAGANDLSFNVTIES